MDVRMKLNDVDVCQVACEDPQGYVLLGLPKFCRPVIRAGDKVRSQR